MKQLLIIASIILAVGLQRRPVVIQPCSNQVKVVYFLNGKQVHIDTFELMGSNYNGEVMRINCNKHPKRVTYFADSTTTSMK